MMPCRLTAFVSALTLSAALTLADVVNLKDGTRLEGTVRHNDDGWVVKSNGKSIQIPADQVESIELIPTTSPSPAVAAERLNSLRRSVENLADLNDIISRFQRFVDQNTDPAALIEAKKDLAVWQDRSVQKMVKAGTKWVLPAELTVLFSQAQVSAETARQLMKQGRTKEAEPILLNVLLIDPQNPTALYLIGVLRYQQDQVLPARKAFDAVAAVVPNHAPTLNNLGVVQWRQRQYIAAISSLDGAMLASPVNKLILDNTAVALQLLPIESRSSPIVKKALRHFQEQDQQLAERMAREGMHRFGSLWVTDKDIEQFKIQEKQIQDKLDQLSGDFDHLKDRVDQLNRNISDNQIQIHRIESSSFIVDPRTGIIYSVAYPAIYYQLQSDNDKMARERDVDVAKLDGLKKQAQDLQNSKPSAKNQAVQRMFGAEATPLRVTPASQPAAK